jgi:hypothetical protein
METRWDDGSYQRREGGGGCGIFLSLEGSAKFTY